MIAKRYVRTSDLGVSECVDVCFLNCSVVVKIPQFIFVFIVRSAVFDYSSIHSDNRHRMRLTMFKPNENRKLFFFFKFQSKFFHCIRSCNTWGLVLSMQSIMNGIMRHNLFNLNEMKIIFDIRFHCNIFFFLFLQKL